MKTIEEYTDAELSLLLSKTVNVYGGRERLAAIQAEIDRRGLSDKRSLDLGENDA